jgi:hypothetical protein
MNLSCSLHYFWHTFIYPFLAAQRQLGDAYLQTCDGSPGNSIPSKNAFGLFIVTVTGLGPTALACNQ